MSRELKILFVFAMIVFGAILYLKRKPVMEITTSPPIQSLSESTETPGSSTEDLVQVQADLWNAISPCWNRLADKSTLPTQLKLNLSANGELASPPEIERDLNTPITDQSLKSEALALRALAECGPYPMARGQRGLKIQFRL